MKNYWLAIGTQGDNSNKIKTANQRQNWERSPDRANHSQILGTMQENKTLSLSLSLSGTIPLASAEAFSAVAFHKRLIMQRLQPRCVCISHIVCIFLQTVQSREQRPSLVWPTFKGTTLLKPPFITTGGVSNWILTETVGYNSLTVVSPWILTSANRTAIQTGRYNDNDVHLSGAHQRPERSPGTY